MSAPEGELRCPFAGGGGGGPAVDPPAGKDGDGKCPASRPSPTYGSYLQVENLLKLQLPESDAAGTPAHDELLFIIIHQTYELWFKQVLHEINWLRETFAAAVIDEAVMLKVVRILQRVVEILKICAAQIQILHTMTPAGFLEFRNLLGTSSGFQSVQFRLLEIRLGLKRGSRIRYRSKDYNEELTAEEAAVVLKAESEDSLHDLIETWLERTPGLESGWWEGFQANVEGDNAAARAEAEAIADPRDREDALKTCTSNEETFKTIFDSESHAELMEEGSRSLSFEASKAALMISLLREKPRFHLPDKMLQLLQDVDTQLLGWRHNHVGVVQRTIGAKPGTGGSSGYSYLRSTVSDRYKVFKDLSNLATFVVPRNLLPPLDEQTEIELSFSGENRPRSPNPKA